MQAVAGIWKNGGKLRRTPWGGGGRPVALTRVGAAAPWLAEESVQSEGRMRVRLGQV